MTNFIYEKEEAELMAAKWRIPPRLDAVVFMDVEYMEVEEEDDEGVPACLLSAEFMLEGNEVHVKFHNRTTELTFDLDRLASVVEALQGLRAIKMQLKSND